MQPGVYALPNATVQGATMTVTGQANPGQWVSIIAERADGKRCYLGQVTADPSGNYSTSFTLNQGSYRAVVSAGGQQAATAYQPVTVDPPGSGNNGGGSISLETNSSTSQAYVSVKGDSSTGIILSATAWQWKGSCTVMQALKGVLDSQGIHYQIDESIGYVRSIGGLSEKKLGYPLSGWICRINGQGLPSGANSVNVNKGDRMEWLYTLDGGKDLGDPLAETPLLQQIDEQTSKQLREQMSSYDKVLTGLKGCRLMNATEQMTKLEAQALEQKLIGNQVAIQVKVTNQGGPIADNQQEIALLFPQNAFNTETTVGVQEVKGDVDSNDTAWKPYSSIYQLQPDGSKFANPVRISIKLPIFPGLKAENLTPAWFNPSLKQWEALPGIIDMKNGMAVFDTTHFSNFAVVEKVDTLSVSKSNTLQTSSSTYDYSEVEKNYPWALAAIKALSSQGIMVGSEQGFEPGRVITRAEMAALLQRAIKPPSTQADMVLKDVPAGAWYYPVMQTAVKAGWISGYPDKTYHPEAVVNRYEAAGMLYNTVSSKGQGLSNGGASFSDYQQAPAWAQPALGYMAAKGLMHGYPDGSFGGDKPMNRAQAALIIWGLLNDR